MVRESIFEGRHILLLFPLVIRRIELLQLLQIRRQEIFASCTRVPITVHTIEHAESCNNRRSRDKKYSRIGTASPSLWTPKKMQNSATIVDEKSRKTFRGQLSSSTLGCPKLCNPATIADKKTRNLLLRASKSGKNAILQRSHTWRGNIILR